ncbi:MAG TPA: hypothetical protein VEL05_01180, partial [Candidatus Acidoferrum sp.]|nr:hypothetical protein [Candidatus Acidoferrum sp.]
MRAEEFARGNRISKEMGSDREHRKDHERRSESTDADELAADKPGAEKPGGEKIDEKWMPSPGKVSRSAGQHRARSRRSDQPTPGRVTLTMGLERRPHAAPVFRHATGAAEPAADAARLVRAARSSSGQPLPEQLARRLEPSLG